jgi:hypothetical protein
MWRGTVTVVTLLAAGDHRVMGGCQSLRVIDGDSDVAKISILSRSIDRLSTSCFARHGSTVDQPFPPALSAVSVPVKSTPPGDLTMRWLVHVLARPANTATCTTSAAALEALFKHPFSSATAKCLFSGTERFFRPGYNANLVSNWIPTLEGVEAKLKAGARWPMLDAVTAPKVGVRVLPTFCLWPIRHIVANWAAVQRRGATAVAQRTLSGYSRRASSTSRRKSASLHLRCCYTLMRRLRDYVCNSIF